MKNTSKLAGRTALVTGAAKRLGAATARALHAEGMNLLLHYHKSEAEAVALAAELNQARPDSAAIAQADLANTQGLESLVKAALQWNGLDVLINNASSFRPTPLGQIGEDDWDDLMGSNLKAPLFLAQAAAPHLKKNQGCIVNMIDIHDAALVLLQVRCRGLGPELGRLGRGTAPEEEPGLHREHDRYPRLPAVAGTHRVLRRQGGPGHVDAVAGEGTGAGGAGQRRGAGTGAVAGGTHGCGHQEIHPRSH